MSTTSIHGGKPARRSIIAGVDGSRQSVRAAAVAASLARGLERRLVLVHVAADPPVFPYGDLRVREAQRRRLVRRGLALLAVAASEIREEQARRRVVLSGIAHGGLQERLDAVAREEHADLLVVGARGRHPVARALLGSPSTPMGGTGSCPVLVVPPGDGDPFAGRERPRVAGLEPAQQT
ncbi:MAG: universal stress protein [Thermoleophilaceae bacterium]